MIDFTNDYIKTELKERHIPRKCYDCKHISYRYYHSPADETGGFFYCRDSEEVMSRWNLLFKLRGKCGYCKSELYSLIERRDCEKQ